MEKTIRTTVIVLLTGLVMVSCTPNTPSQKTINYPKITERGVEPFILGASMREMPQNGEYYDTIVYKFKFYVRGSLDDEFYVWDEHQLEEYKRAVKNGETFYNDIDVHGYTIGSAQADCYVVSEGDTLMIVNCNSDWKIICIKVLSDKLKFDNGIHVCLSSTDMISTYNADFICESFSILCRDTDSVDMGYRVPVVPKNVQFFSSQNNKIKFKLDESGYIMIPIHGNEITTSSSVHTVPLEDVKDDCLDYIVIHGQCDHHNGSGSNKNDFFNF